MSQFYVTNLGIISDTNVLHNEYFLLMNIDNLMNAQGKEWYEAAPKMSQIKFMEHLARLVHKVRFGYKGVEEMLKRLQDDGYIICEPLKVQVTDKWRDIVEANGGYIQYKISDEALLKKVDDLFADVWTPKTKNLKEYKETVRQFTYEAKKALKRGILKPEWKERLVKFEALLKSDFLLKQFFEARLKANAEADNPPNAPPNGAYTEGGQYSNIEMQKQIDGRLNWRINLSMTEAMFFQELKNTKYWIELKSKRKMTLTEAEKSRLEWALEGLTDIEGSKALYRKRIASLKAKEAENQGPVDPTVAAVMAKAKLTTVKEA
jgi:hypothetical protein